MPNRKVSQDEVQVQKALQAKHQRSGHLGGLRKQWNYVQDLCWSPDAQEGELANALLRYEVFCKFVDSHDNYLRYEDDEERR